ncbi:hypothetical protein BJV82DRAFT_556233 [Fennellomyces sp. T-0311]|nr:hypothetical protein BJV82DRAFT_556233 [Fennellomyces sp. T-0311]
MNEETKHKTLNVLETYFSDASLNWDKNLQQHLKDDPEGYVPFEKLAPLKRFKELDATAGDIKEAAQSSVRLKVNESGTAVARIKPFVLNKKEELDDWSIYVEGLRQPNDNQTKISQLFGKLVGHVSMVRFPQDKANSSKFHGQCFVEFSNQEDVEKAVEQMDCSRGQEREGEVKKLFLRVMTKNEYRRLEKQYLDHQEAVRAGIKRAWDEYNNDEKEEETAYPKGVVAFVTNLAMKTSKTTIKKLLDQSGIDLAYVDYKKNASSCHIRAQSSEDVDKLVAFFTENAKIQAHGKDATGEPASEATMSQAIRIRKVTGEEERIFWQDEKMALIASKQS